MCRLGDVSQQVVGLDEVIARVHVSGVLERQRQSRRSREMHAQPELLADPVAPSAVSNIWTYTVRDVAPHPLFEDVDQEPAVPPGLDRAAQSRRRRSATYSGRSRHEDHGTVRIAERLRRHPLDDRDELHEPRSTLVAQEPVDLVAAVSAFAACTVVRMLYSTPCSAQVAQAAHHVVEGAVRHLWSTR